MSRRTMEDRMEKIEDIRPTSELTPEMIKSICDAISQEFSRWEFKDEEEELRRRRNRLGDIRTPSTYGNGIGERRCN
jgi:hypothetical protein